MLPNFLEGKKGEEVDEEAAAANAGIKDLFAGVDGNPVFPSIVSFRSPVHKDLFRSRNKVFAEFQEYFKEPIVSGVTKDLKARLLKEKTGDRNWNRMVDQLLSGGEDFDESLKTPDEEEAPAAEEEA